MPAPNPRLEQRFLDEDTPWDLNWPINAEHPVDALPRPTWRNPIRLLRSWRFRRLLKRAWPPEGEDRSDEE